MELLHFLLFLSTPSSHPPSLPPLSFSSLPALEKKKKVPPGFLALKGQKQTGSWQASNSPGSGYKGEGGDRTGQGKREGKQERKWKAEKNGRGAGKTAVWCIFWSPHGEEQSLRIGLTYITAILIYCRRPVGPKVRFWGIEAEREHEKSRELQRKAVAEEVIGGQPYENFQPWVQGFGVWGKKNYPCSKVLPRLCFFWEIKAGDLM